MNCLLAAATIKEIIPFMNHYRKQVLLPAHLNIDVLITGIGLTATSYSLARYFGHKRPDLVIQAGLAGCFDKNFSLGTVVAVKQDTVADQSVMEKKKLLTLFDLGLMKQNQFPYAKGWLRNNNSNLLKSCRLKSVNGITVNQVSTSKQMIKFYQRKFNPVIESMEGAALHYVCLMEKIPFLQVRSISNYAGERNKQKWNLKESIINLNNKLISILETLNTQQ